MFALMTYTLGCGGNSNSRDTGGAASSSIQAPADIGAEVEADSQSKQTSEMATVNIDNMFTVDFAWVPESQPFGLYRDAAGAMQQDTPPTSNRTYNQVGNKYFNFSYDEPNEYQTKYSDYVTFIQESENNAYPATFGAASGWVVETERGDSGKLLQIIFYFEMPSAPDVACRACTIWSLHMDDDYDAREVWNDPITQQMLNSIRIP